MPGGNRPPTTNRQKRTVVPRCAILQWSALFCIMQFPAASCAKGAAARPRGAGSLGGAAVPPAQETAGNCTMQN
eukprot:15466160-Alexandrium_andersonii.AAC.1